MPDVPTLFNRLDFIGLLLPGYVVVTSYLGLFRSDLMVGQTSLTFDVFSTIVFIVAGPAAGIALRQAHHSVKGMWDSKFGVSRKRYMENLQKYARIRLKMTADQKGELDEILAYYDCSVSLGTGFLLIDLSLLSTGYAALTLMRLGAVAAGLFFVTAYFVKEAYYNPLMRELGSIYKQLADVAPSPGATAAVVQNAKCKP